jgi:hypothetical protein
MLQVAHFLEAPKDCWVSRFWAATPCSVGSLSIPSAVQRDLDRATPDVAAALHRGHPHVADVLARKDAGLASKLEQLPARLHAAACDAVAIAGSRTLHVRAISCDSSDLQSSAQRTLRVAAALSSTTAVDTVSLFLTINSSGDSVMLGAVHALATAVHAAPRAPHLSLSLLYPHHPPVVAPRTAKEAFALCYKGAPCAATARQWLEQLARTPSCTLWRLDACGAVVGALPALRSLRHLELASRLRGNSVQVLAATLPRTAHLSQLHLTFSNDVDAPNAAALAASIAQLPCLQHLALSTCWFAFHQRGGSELPLPAPGHRLADALQPHILGLTALTALSLQQLPFTVHCAAPAARRCVLPRLQALRLCSMSAPFLCSLQRAPALTRLALFLGGDSEGAVAAFEGAAEAGHISQLREVQLTRGHCSAAHRGRPRAPHTAAAPGRFSAAAGRAGLRRSGAQPVQPAVPREDSLD